MTAIIITITVVIIAIITMKAQAKANAIFTPREVKEHAKYTWHILCHDRVHTVGTHTWNKTNAVLCIMFTILSVALLDTGFFVANVMQNNGTHVAGMGWILIASYVFGTVGSMAYAVGCGAHAVKRVPEEKCYVL